MKEWVLIIMIGNGSFEPEKIEIGFGNVSKTCVRAERAINAAKSVDTSTIAAWCFRRMDEQQ